MSEKYKFGKIRPPGLDRAHQYLRGTEMEVLEKLDGSNFSFWMEDGRVRCRSRNNMLDASCGKLFSKAWAYCTTLEERLSGRYIYRGEAICAPRHNVLTYDRAPERGLILWALECRDTGDILPHAFMAAEAMRLGLEVSPLLATVTYTGADCLDAYAEGESVLGGPREGIVARTKDGIYAKVVGKRFREKATSQPAKRRKTEGEVVAAIAEQYCTEARWGKALQHLRESNALTGSMRDVGALIKRVNQDVEEEEREVIMSELYSAFRKQILRASHHGIAQWYEKELADE